MIVPAQNKIACLTQKGKELVLPLTLRFTASIAAKYFIQPVYPPLLTYSITFTVVRLALEIGKVYNLRSINCIEKFLLKMHRNTPFFHIIAFACCLLALSFFSKNSLIFAALIGAYEALNWRRNLMAQTTSLQNNNTDNTLTAMEAF